jgi:hypothetical protein
VAGEIEATVPLKKIEIQSWRLDEEEGLRRLEKQAHHGEDLREGFGSVEGEECLINGFLICEIGRILVQIKPQWISPEVVNIKGLKGRLLGGVNDFLSHEICEKRGRQSVNCSRGIR